MKNQSITKPKPKKSGVDLINKFLNHLRSGINDKLNEKTIKQYQEAIWDYWEFVGYDKNLKTTFNQKFAKMYVDFLAKKSIKIKTQVRKRTYVISFYQWLCDGRTENNDDFHKGILILRPDKREAIAISTQVIQKYPTQEEFDKIIDFPIKTKIDLRDKALLCFFYLSAGRIDAVRTAPISSFNPETLEFNQNPNIMNTKRNKCIDSVLFPFGEKYVNIIREWVNYLTKEKHLTPDKPLFPKLIQNPDNISDYILSDEYYKTQAPISNMIKTRYTSKGIKPYSVHKFRHLACDSAFKLARNLEDVKAISQNMGHSALTTTLKNYANMQPQKYKEIIRNLGKPISDYDNCKICDLSDSELSGVLNKRLEQKREFS